MDVPRIVELDHFQSDFSEHVFIQVGAKAAKRAMRLWQRTGLPEPARNQFSYNDHSVAVPLNEYGISFVFRAKSRNPFMHDLYEGSLVRHDALLQPLYRRALDDMACFEIRPGIKRVRASEKELAALKHVLKEGGLKFYARDDAMIGVLPTGRRDLVVANPSAIKRRKKRGAAPVDMPLQSKVFGELAAYVTDAFSSASKTRIEDALGVCRAIVSKPEGDPGKILHGVWSIRKVNNLEMAEPRPVISA